MHSTYILRHIHGILMRYNCQSKIYSFVCASRMCNSNQHNFSCLTHLVLGLWIGQETQGRGRLQDLAKRRIDGFKDGRRAEVGNAGRARASGDGVGRGRPGNAGRARARRRSARASGCGVGGEGDSPDQATRASGVGRRGRGGRCRGRGRG